MQLKTFMAFILRRHATARYQTSILSHAGALRNNSVHGNEATVNII